MSVASTTAEPPSAIPASMTSPGTRGARRGARTARAHRGVRRGLEVREALGAHAAAHGREPGPGETFLRGRRCAQTPPYPNTLPSENGVGGHVYVAWGPNGRAERRPSTMRRRCGADMAIAARIRAAGELDTFAERQPRQPVLAARPRWTPASVRGRPRPFRACCLRGRRLSAGRQDPACAWASTAAGSTVSRRGRAVRPAGLARRRC